MIRKPASHPALGWGFWAGGSCLQQYGHVGGAWAQGPVREAQVGPLLSSGPPACPASHPKAPLPLSGATRPHTAAGPARAGPEEAGLGSCQCCLGEEVGILSVSVKAGVG